MHKLNLKLCPHWLIPVFAVLFFGAIFAFPETAHAILGTDTGSAMASNLRNTVGPIMQYVWDLIMQLLNGLLFLYVSTYLLETAINYSPAWINADPTRNPFVASGLSITTAMADIALIVVFIAIAIGYVFKMESYNNKKVVIRFFAAALLIHFAPVFVGMLIDISNIITSGIMIGKETIITTTFKQFSGDILLSLATLTGTYLGASALLATPELGSVAAAGIVIAFFGAGMFSVIPHFIIQGLVLTTINGVLFSYAMFFLTRIFVMQILVVLGPLAILAGTIDITKRFYNMWIEWLLSWSFGGILMLFLLVLGLSASNILGTMPPSAVPLSGAGLWINTFMEIHFHWFALAIYLMTVETICAGLVPALAGKVASAFTSGGGKLASIGGGLDPHKAIQKVADKKEAAKNKQEEWEAKQKWEATH